MQPQFDKNPSKTQLGLISWIPLVLALTAIAVFVTMIVNNERHLANSDPMYIQLQPVDPRSLIQGDYMMLGYELYLSAPNEADTDNINTQNTSDWQPDLLKARGDIKAWVVLDPQRKVTKTVLNKGELTPAEAANARPLVLKNPNQYREAFYPAANSFMFAEGLADCYQRARYALFKVNAKGQPMLADLVDANLRDLQCEAYGQTSTN